MIELVNVEKKFSPIDPPILKNISLKIESQEFVSIWGRSGSGKTTLLYILSSLDKPSRGKVLYNQQNLNELPEKSLLKIRNQDFGFIFQFHYLLAELTVLENVLLPARKSGQEKVLRSYAEHLLEWVGIVDKKDRLPRQLSGGEQQRVAIARALVMKPRYLFADEPTGSLDSKNAERVMTLLQDAHQKNHTAIVLVTHEPDYARVAQRIIHLIDGQISSQNPF